MDSARKTVKSALRNIMKYEFFMDYLNIYIEKEIVGKPRIEIIR